MNQLRSMGESEHANEENEHARFFKKGDKNTEHFFHSIVY